MPLDDSENHSTSIHMPVLIVKKNPFTEAEYQKLWEVVNEQGREPIHLKPITDQNTFFYNFTRGGFCSLLSKRKIWDKYSKNRYLPLLFIIKSIE